MERTESLEICEFCRGTGWENSLSVCCGARFINPETNETDEFPYGEICSRCKEYSTPNICLTCNGAGKIIVKNEENI